uniref:Uncharacterized protein n=1 Tax=Myoviridae sp. ctj3P51 TaxID=2826687 RepID=A0A8S5NQD7_9CAUD|nr:MAG TPA: hypothetical protein [Myoviridae sp. ctj3P51]
MSVLEAHYQQGKSAGANPVFTARCHVCCWT